MGWGQFLRNSKIVTYERNYMLSTARQTKYRKIKQGPKMLNFGVSQPGIGGGGDPRLDLVSAYNEVAAR